jgi:hypothetical protein
LILSLIHLLAESSSPTSGLGWEGQLLNFGGIGIVGIVLGWRLKLSDDSNRAKDQELRDTNAKLLDLAERAIPVLSEATRALTEVAHRHGDADGTGELRQQLRRLEGQLDNLGNSRRD